MLFLEFLRRAAPALALGFLLSFGSSIGQTYFISLFSGELRAELGLGHGGFGTLYMVATACSALALIWVGKLADSIAIPHLAVATMLTLAASALLMAHATSIVAVGLAIFLLRLGGQGMMTHLAATAMARWFDRERGRALSVAQLGFPAGEAILPILVAVALTAMHWRDVWLMGAALMVGVFIPLALLFTRGARAIIAHAASPAPSHAAGPAHRSWNRTEVLRDPRFYALLPGLLAPPFIITGVLFHQVHLIEVKGWTLRGFTAGYPLYAGGAVAASLAGGWLIDRFSAVRLLPFYLIPMALGLLVLGSFTSIGTAWIFMTGMGATAGAAAVIKGAIWAELYGTEHLGAIRSLGFAAMVMSTALAPSLMGWLIDGGVSLDAQIMAMAGYSLACAVGFGFLRARLATCDRSRA